MLRWSKAERELLHRTLRALADGRADHGDESATASAAEAQKSGVLDWEPKAVAELVKLPEYTAETGAIDFQENLYLAEQQIGTLASGAGERWAKTLKVAQTAYAEYQTLSPVRRLGVVATLTPELKEEKYKKLERKLAALVLASPPKHRMMAGCPSLTPRCGSRLPETA